MLNQLFAKIESLISKSNTRTTALLQPILAPLAEIDAQLPADCMAFILKGEHAEVLMSLQHLPDDKACALLGKPGTYRYFWPQANISKAQEKLAKASTKARKELYEALFDLLEPEQIIRYGKVIAAATQQRNLAHLYPVLPIWLHYVVIDALVTSFNDLGFSEQDHSKAMRQHWSMQKLHQLLDADEAGLSPYLIGFLFERQDQPSYYSDELSLLFKLPDTQSYIQQHIQQLPALITSLGIDAQLSFLDYLPQHNELLQQLAQLVVQLAVSKSKKVREAANSLLGNLSNELCQSHFTHYLREGQSSERGYAAELMARYGQDNLAILEQAHADEKLKSVQHFIMSAMQRLQSINALPATVDYELPAFTPVEATLITDSFSSVVKENYAAILEKAQQSARDEIEENKTRDYKYHWANQNLKKLEKVKVDALERVVPYLNGETGLKAFDSAQQIISYKNQLKNLPEYSILHAIRLLGLGGRNHMYWPSLFEQLKPEQYSQLEARHYVDLLTRSHYPEPKRAVAKALLMDAWNSLADYIDSGDKIWPFFAENIDYLSEALGLSPSLEKNQYQHFEPSRAIQVLRYFPSLPQQFVPRLLEYALGENKRLRYDAQQALHTLPDIQQRAIEALGSGKQEIRITAIEWLARLQHPDAVPALNALLKTEKKEIVRAALLTALEQLGQDISPYLSAAVLLKEAEKGLKTKLSASLTWFDFSNLPALTWQSGKAVDAMIIQWWVVLAEKLKEPKANQLLQRYVGLLDEKSQQQLALHVLQAFIHQDTRGPTLDEATEMAVKHAPGRLQNYQDWYKRYPEYYAKYANATLDQIVDEIKREHMATYLGSAIKSKGVLALTHTAQGSHAVKQLQDYMKQHYQRRSQIEAMINALSLSNDPLIIQLLLGLSRRYRTTSVQNLANALVSEIAERNHWSNDELADRTIPTAGLDEKGILHLDFGSRQFTAYVDDKDKLVLKNEDGKVIKALPAARQNDDESLIKEAKALFSNSKKELKQVIDLQSLRLYEAMCGQRQWPVAEWQAYIYAHPIMRRLIQGLVWLETSADGQQQHFRPSDDGSLLNLDDDEIELSADSKIQVSHAVFVSEDEAAQWIAHFKDYKVKFLFAQMSNRLPDLTDAKATVIEDRKGWLTDTYTLRGVITKLGYQRAAIEDGGSFDRYTKSFGQLGLHVQISFSGSYVPEENIPAVLYDLSFDRQGRNSWNQDLLSLHEVPPILLAECYADYLKIAAACSGFDPEWQKKTPW
ncbi:HEAT repeat protein [Acinetobacter calcoaceticus]|uniref:HEAT repeat protein n=1 Tax=Acinetobacter calcoaceticus TaxID=471 RepID=A0A4V6NJ72_ACICA|nr:HEAT repeat protein [Acinetobacter calcoaceticus]